MEGKGAAGLAHGAQIDGIGHHLRHGHLGLHNLVAVAGGSHSHHPAPALVQVTDDIAHIAVGNRNLQLTDRLQQHRGSLGQRSLVGQLGGSLKGDFGRVHRVVGAIHQGGLQEHHRIARQHTVLARLPQALLHSGEEVLRHTAAEHLLGKDHLLALVLGLKDNMHIAELAAAAGLLLMTALLAHLLADLLAVGHPGGIQLRIHTEAALQLADQHINLNVTGAGDHHLVGLGVIHHRKGGIFLVQADQAGANLLVLATGLGGDGAGIAGLGKLHGGQLHNFLRIAEGVAGLDPVHLGDGADIAAGDLLDFLVLLALDGVQAAQLLSFPGGGIVERHIAGDLAGNDLHKGVLAVLIGDGLEHDGGGGAVGVPGHFHRVLAGLVAGGLVGHLHGAGHQIHNGLQQHLRAKARQSGAAHHGGQGALAHAHLQAVHNLLFGEGFTGEELLHVLLGGLRHSLHKFVIQLVDHAHLVLGDGDLHTLAPLVVPYLVGLLVEHINDADGPLVLVPDGGHHRRDGLAQILPQSLQGGGEVGVLIVLLGHVHDAGLALLLQILPAALGAHTESILGGTHQYAHLGGPDAGLHLAGKVKVAGGVQNVDLDAIVGHRGHGQRNGNLALNLLRVIIANGVSIRGLAQTVGHAGDIQNTLHERGLAAAAVSQQADVANVHS